MAPASRPEDDGLDGRLLTTKEAARLLGVSKAFLDRDRWLGPEIPYVRLGARAVRYRSEDLEQFIRARTRGAIRA